MTAMAVRVTRHEERDVLPVNNAPSFTKGADQNHRQRSHFQSVTNWAHISSGSLDEAAQASLSR